MSLLIWCDAAWGHGVLANAVRHDRRETMCKVDSGFRKFGLMA